MDQGKSNDKKFVDENTLLCNGLILDDHGSYVKYASYDYLFFPGDKVISTLKLLIEL